jgi:peptidoglycan hydrolase-like protein with peptidoglycan-binding domain
MKSKPSPPSRRRTIRVLVSFGGSPSTASSARSASRARRVFPLGATHHQQIVDVPHPFLIRARPVDGIFRPRTQDAVRRLRRAGGLSADGIVGSRTRRVLAKGSSALGEGLARRQPT